MGAGALGLLAGLGLAPAAFAAPDEGTIDSLALRTFDPAFYASTAPRSALDMVDQTPGFSIKDADGRRGMGGGSANVLIDSRRIPAKTMSARETLSRISADQVVRIEILDGARLDLPGLTGQVINIITRPAGMTGRWEWSPEVQEGQQAQLARGRVVVSGELSDWKYNFGLSSYEWAGGSAGPETLFDGDGLPVEFRAEDESWNGRRHELSTAFSTENLSGDISNIGLVVAASEDARKELSYRPADASPDRLRTYDSAADGANFRLNADHEFAFGPGRLKLIGLRSTSSSEPVTSTMVEEIAAANPASGAQVLVDRSTGESILRGEYAWAGKSGDWQMALEGATNTLDTATAYAVFANGAYVGVPLAGGTSHVEEKRTEAALVHGRSLSGGVFMQASLAAEHSEIAQTGPNGKVREFMRPKGFVTVSWSPATDWNASVRLERAVGQLDFGDFISSVNLSDETGQQQSGNPEIVPEQSWDLALEATGAMGRLGPVRVKLYGRQIEDVNSSVLFARTVDTGGAVSITEGPGNVGEAVSYGVDLSGTLPTTGLGIPGGKLDWSASLRDSEIEDPVLGDTRNLSGTRHSAYSLNFRQDLPGTPWAWGVGYDTSRNAPGFGVTQQTWRWNEPGHVGVFLQHKDIAGMNGRLSFSNLTDVEERFIRVSHAGDVSDPVAFIEDRTRRQGMHVGFNLSGSF